MTSDGRSSPASISVVVPVFRSSSTLERLCDELETALRELTDDFEVILVDDGSGDDSWAGIGRLVEGRPWLLGVTLQRNYGQHNALLAGLRMTSKEILVTIDDDLQNPPSEIAKLLESLTSDVDLVYGRPTTEQQGPFRNLSSKMAKRTMAQALGSEVYPYMSSFRLFRRSLIAEFDKSDDPLVSIDVLLSWATTRIASRHVDHRVRAEGRSNYTVGKLLRHAANMITGYSTRPLRWVSVAGFLFALLGFALLLFVLTRWVLGDTGVAGFSFLASAITLFSGVQLLSLGILGEYIGRMHLRTMRRPAYIVRSTIGGFSPRAPGQANDPESAGDRRVEARASEVT